MNWRNGGFRRTIVLLLPLSIILLTPHVAGWHSVLPAAYLAAKPDGQTSEALNGLAGSLISLALATIVASVFILREEKSPDRFAIMLPVAIFLISSSSIYAGYRLQIGVIEQLNAQVFDLNKVRDRLDWQGTALFAAVTGLFLQGLEHLTKRSFLTDKTVNATSKRGAPRRKGPIMIALYAVMAATAAPLTLPAEIAALTTSIKRVDCVKDCEISAIIADSAMDWRFRSAPSMAAGDAKALAAVPRPASGNIGCIVNPVVTDFESIDGQRRFTGILIGVRLARLAPTTARAGAIITVPVLVQIGHRGLFGLAGSRQAPVAPKPENNAIHVEYGKWCGDREFADNLEKAGWSLVDPSTVLIPLPPGVYGIIGPRRYSTLNLRLLGDLASGAAQKIYSLMPSIQQLKPSNWLLNWNSESFRQIEFRSTPSGATVLLDRTDLGIKTDQIVSVDAAYFRKIRFRNGRRIWSIDKCSVTEQRDADSDAIVDCDFK